MAMANTDNTTLITNLCTTKFAILKWLQMLCYIIIVFFLIDGHRQWGIYTFMFICAIIFGILCLATLLINYFLSQPRATHQKIEIIFNVIALIFCLIFFGILAVDYAKMNSGNYNFHKYLPPPNIGKEGWRNRILVVLITEALNAILHGLSIFGIKK
uniref:Uncharacterized protein n=1 Tax=Meloidogyne enterolobii TaxID=390850 RepID=A0A6V7UAC8_MELEN|nr:unnamed protein product [Meloidogyne enterolobii]